MSALIQELHKISEKYNISIEEMKHILSNETISEREKKIREKVSENESLVGLYFVIETNPRNGMFPKMKKYYHVLSARSENEYRIECLCFYEHPFYWFDYIMHKAHFAGDFYLGSFEFDSIWRTSILASDVERMKEISKEEFDQAMRNYIEELIQMDWRTEHYRYGGYLPSDEKWKEHPNLSWESTI